MNKHIKGLLVGIGMVLALALITALIIGTLYLLTLIHPTVPFIAIIIFLSYCLGMDMVKTAEKDNNE